MESLLEIGKQKVAYLEAAFPKQTGDQHEFALLHQLVDTCQSVEKQAQSCLELVERKAHKLAMARIIETDVLNKFKMEQQQKGLTEEAEELQGLILEMQQKAGHYQAMAEGKADSLTAKLS